MYYYSKMSPNHIVHTEKCECIDRISKENLGTFKTLKEAVRAGYRLCKYCNPVGECYREEEKELLAFCAENGLSIHMMRKGLKVTSTISKWIVAAADNKSGTMLYHMNEFEKKREEDYIPGYHCQNVCYSDLLSYLKYIVEHDWYRNCNPVPLPKAKTPPPQKGTKRYRKEQAKLKRREKRASIANVMELINSLGKTEARTASA